ncbi:helix-turn-helix transcriptional regulator [Serratia fonticola]|uniref:helix-turn-helix domain-containing protein n=1 Tax=Serratia fonticola TaxID=47917 RepID=UPI003AAB6FFB
MKKPSSINVVIALNDSNLFFLQGMQYFFTLYFHDRGIRVVFNSTTENQEAELVVTNCSSLRPREPAQLRVTFRSINQWGEYSYRQRTVSCYEKIEIVSFLLDELFNTTVSGSSPPNILDENIGIRITRRENEVLRGIAMGLPAILIAKKLKVNVKTVSAHKLSVMHKLGFRNCLELYVWLLRVKNI